MKKRDLTLKSLAIAGLATGLIITAQGHTTDSTKQKPKQETTSNKKSTAAKTDDFDKAFEKYDGNITYHPFTEAELLRELTPEGQRMYNSLSPEGKELARNVASQTCTGQNECKGLNACETPDHKCAGKGTCKGKSKCALGDKNLAVKLVYDKMKNKRQALSE